MKITILGSGTCASGVTEAPDRFPPGFYVEWEGGSLLLDCSEGIHFRLAKAGIEYAAIQHMAITHSHPDHYALVPFVQAVFCKGLWGSIKNEKLNVYAPSYIVDNYPTMWNLYWQDRLDNPFDYPKLNLVTMPSGSVDLPGGAKLTAAKVYHGFGKIEALAFRLETAEGILVYSGDCGESESIREISKDADIFICDSTAKIGDLAMATAHGHLSPYGVGDISKASNVKSAVLTHYTGLDSEADMIADCQKSGFEGKISLAKDSEVITI